MLSNSGIGKHLETLTWWYSTNYQQAMDTESSVDGGAPSRSQPESFRGRDLFASLTVNDLEKSLAWYCDVMGFTIERRIERDGRLVAVSLKAGTVGILIGQDNGAKGLDRVKGQGLSLQITTAQNIDELAERVKAAGGILEMEASDAPWGARVFRVKDPDGFLFAISSPNPST